MRPFSSLNRFHRKSPPIRSGFSLLELMIVLVILVGVMAISWPNIQKRLRHATLDQAALTLCQAIDDARQQAIREGKPIIIALMPDDDRMSIGEFTLINAMSLNSSVDAPTAASLNSSLETPVDATRLQQIEFPDGVFVADVQWKIPTVADQSNSDTELTDPTLDSSSQDDAKAEMDTITASESEMLNALNSADSTVWYLIIDASGQFGDAMIELNDSTSQNSVTVQMAAATGSVEVVP